MLQYKINEMVKRYPDSVALVFQDKEMTYGELHQRSNAIASELKKAGVVKGDIAAVFAERSFHMIEIILGIWKPERHFSRSILRFQRNEFNICCMKVQEKQSL